MFVIAAIADLRTFVAAHGPPCPAVDGVAAAEPAGMTVLLFRFRPYCAACSRVERMVREVAGRMPSVEVRSVDLSDPANRHCIIDYGIQTETALLHDGERFVMLDKCFRSVRDEAAFKACLADAIGAFAGRAL